MTKLDLDHFRTALLEERRRVSQAIDFLHETNPGTLDEETGELGTGTADNHPGDVATATFDREMDQTLEANEVNVLTAIDAALKRIEEGSFGSCERCGKPIEPDRLEFLPYATLCIEDKRREERG